MSKDKRVRRIILILILLFICLKAFLIYTTVVEKYTIEAESVFVKSNLEENIKISTAKKINNEDLDKIINENRIDKNNREEITVQEEELEYITKYRKTDELYEGTTKIAQEGRNGVQKITTKKIFDENNNLIKEIQISAIITKASLNKIIEIGTKKKEVIQVKNSDLDFYVPLNKPSGFSLEQFENAFTDSKDKNKIFKNNAQYFYYIEDEYNINGMFVAAVGIHESAWGTSKIATKKFNLFGYGAYDSNPYNGAYNFESYSESIDLLARVFTKYYINPKGTKIYDNQIADGRYYNGNTIEAVGKKYATDKNWANGVYKHMQYLYSKAKSLNN